MVDFAGDAEFSAKMQKYIKNVVTVESVGSCSSSEATHETVVKLEDYWAENVGFSDAYLPFVVKRKNKAPILERISAFLCMFLSIGWERRSRDDKCNSTAGSGCIFWIGSTKAGRAAVAALKSFYGEDNFSLIWAGCIKFKRSDIGGKLCGK